MATNSPQRSRRPQAQQSQQQQGPVLNHPTRDASPSPPGSISQRPRAAKAQSMPLVPSITSFSGQNGQQPSPTIRRSSPSLGPGQVARLLPTPPHPNPSALGTDDHQIATPLSAQQQQPPHYVRQPPHLRAPTAAYPNKFQELESQMTPEFFADIDRAAEQQQAQSQFSSQQVPSQAPTQSHSYPRVESPSPGKGTLTDRARGVPAERSSPLNPVMLAHRVGNQQQHISRESPKTRDRQTASPILGSFQSQPLAHAPEQQQVQHLQHSSSLSMPGGEPHPASYLAQYNARASDSPTIRRAPNSEPRLTVSMVNQSTPPLQAMAARAPDRSLPVQEEDEILSRNGSLSGRTANQWGMNDNGTQPPFELAASPAPSSDLNPEGNVNASQRFEANARENVHHDEEKAKGPLLQQKPQQEEGHTQYLERGDSADDGSYTPRSPSTGLPNEDAHQMYYPPIRVPVPVPHRGGKARNGSTDHLMRGLESALLDQQQEQQQQHPGQQPQQPQQPTVATAPHHPTQPPERPPPQYVENRQQLPQIDPNHNGHLYRNIDYGTSHNMNYTPTSTTLTSSSTAIETSSSQDYNQGHHTRYLLQPQVYPDDFQANYPDDYYQAYFASPGRPDAPIPPTPHSQTAAPSPSPLIPGYGAQDLPNYRPSRTAGSPYPFPFGHVRRNRPTQSGRVPSGLAMDPNRIARQYQIYAQNAHQGNITDSTLSPSSTPFQPDNLFDQWAYLHTTRTLNLRRNVGMGGVNNIETASMFSSPSHEPLPLPNYSGRKKDKKANGVYKNRNYNRVRDLPPRVESTQPRETSPELSSDSESGEETAGEEKNQFSVGSHETITNDPLPFPVVTPSPHGADSVDESDEWVDEDEEDDYEDLLDLEFHPTFIKNVSKRRRKWEVGWENLIQAFQALDRQTDATMILLASPSHSTKLYTLRSRSIRRRHFLAVSPNMKQIRQGFSRIAAERRTMRPEKSSIVDRLLQNTGDSPNGSDGSSSAVSEGNLKHVLNVALGSLNAMANVYEEREARIMEELAKSRDDRERVELLLRQVMGDGYGLSMGNRNGNVAPPAHMLPAAL